jgi:hypothetical protein
LKNKFAWASITIMIGVVLFCSFGYCRSNHGGPSLQVFIKDEGAHERNITKPRIYVKNIGERRITDFDLRYYFTVENKKRPVIETYYTPGSSVKLTRVSKREYCVCYQFRQVNIEPGGIYPNRDGNSIGIHYDDWSPMNKENDYSNPGSSDWHMTRRVDVEILGGERSHRGHDSYAEDNDTSGSNQDDDNEDGEDY